jgi:hypothetical protein
MPVAVSLSNAPPTATPSSVMSPFPADVVDQLLTRVGKNPQRKLVSVRNTELFLRNTEHHRAGTCRVIGGSWTKLM